jgi:hypothetical protein
MTLVAVWQFEPNLIHAIADSQISREPGNVLTEHGPKILPLTMICRKPAPSGFFTLEAYRAEFGFAFSGSTLPALSTHALANILCNNLVGNPNAPTPSMDEIANAVGVIAHQYMIEIGQLGGPSSVFSAVLFGHCPRSGKSLAFHFEPLIVDGTFSLNIHKYVLGDSDVIIIGTSPGILRKRIEAIRANAQHPIHAADAPITALQALIDEGVIDGVGGAIQQAWATPFKVQIIATASQIAPRPPSPRNLGMFVLGFDIFDMQTIGSFRVSLMGR